MVRDAAHAAWLFPIAEMCLQAEIGFALTDIAVGSMQHLQISRPISRFSLQPFSALVHVIFHRYVRMPDRLSYRIVRSYKIMSNQTSS